MLQKNSMVSYNSSARLTPIPHRDRGRVVRALALALSLLGLAAPRVYAQTDGPTPAELASQVEIRRTTYGIPHIKAKNLRAAGFALGYVQLEDYGRRVVTGLVRARGQLARYQGKAQLDSDFRRRRTYQRALETYHLLEEDTRDILEGFAAGVNYYIELHRKEFPDWVEPNFTGRDVHALGIGSPGEGEVRAFLRSVGAQPDEVQTTVEPEPSPSDGSNAWAFAPSRTKSGKAILMRNPHLSWTAGYYEAHITVPGKLNFYGDFRIGGPLGIIGGFNEHLGWATTNNYPSLGVIYALEVDPTRPDHYLFDGESVPLERHEIEIEYRDDDGMGVEKREFLSTRIGPVIHRDDGKIYVYKHVADGEYRTGEQFLKMMKARSLDEWLDAVRMRARNRSNLIYADREGNIFYVWNASIPSLPHPAVDDSTAVLARGSGDVWNSILPFDSLPQLLNPKGGYVRNENDPPYLTNLHEPLDRASFPDNFPEIRLFLRSQHSLELIHNDEKFSLEDVVRLKHSMRIILADRVKPDLIAAVRASNPSGEVRAAIELLERWDNTVAAESRGAVLFTTWWNRYVRLAPRAAATSASAGFRAEATALFRKPWTPDEPMTTPQGLADPERAVEAFRWAVRETKRRHGSWDVAWGDVHRVRRGKVDVPVGGCAGLLGCFRALDFRNDQDGKRSVSGGDGWVFAVEFADTPRAYSVLGYGQSNKRNSPHYSDQAELFARNEMKPVAFTEADIERNLIRSYRPGEEITAWQTNTPGPTVRGN